MQGEKKTFTKQQRDGIWWVLHKTHAALDPLVVVLDDDPTGVQTVHGVHVYTDWRRETLARAMAEERCLFFILTNSRGLRADESRAIHEEIARNLAAAARSTGREYLLMSRSDSTLRGHYPLETETLRETLEREDGIPFDGELLIPFFGEGGRITIDDIHYVEIDGALVPAGETEFARDKTFGYTASNLREWCEEKTEGRFPASQVVSIGLEELRHCDYEAVTEKLLGLRDFGKAVVNATSYEELAVFTTALLNAIQSGKRFLFRSSASFVKVLGNIADRPLLTRADLMDESSRNGGVVLVGSHVHKTTRQVAALRESDLPLRFLEFNQHRVLEPGGLEDEAKNIREQAEATIQQGQTCVIHTRRERFDLPDGDEQAQLEIAVKISESLIRVIGELEVRPSFIIAKGGITSSDVGTKALRVQRALVMGQALPGIPVWQTGPESKFPGLPYVIFPGNVGADDALKTIVGNLLSE